MSDTEVILHGEMPREVEEWKEWLEGNITRESAVDEDFGLARVAKCLGKSEAVELYWEGAAHEDAGNVDRAIPLYRRAYRQWPALDSVFLGGLPRCVREEAESAGCTQGLFDLIEVDKARASKVMHTSSLLSASDLCAIEEVRQAVVQDSAGVLDNNPQNKTHALKVGTFLNDPPRHEVCSVAPQVVGKLVRFAQAAWEQGEWGGDCGSSSNADSGDGTVTTTSSSSSSNADSGDGTVTTTSSSEAPLCNIRGGVESLSVRVVEHWEYSVGGGLVDPSHYDNDSVLTVVTLLSDPDDFDGGVFRTHEPDGSMLEHKMDQGDAICFVSHKYHNITPLTRGVRRSMVMELWQGGTGHVGR